ncbi:ABC transporter permease [Saccharospirillum salsuginis]|uniref:ABC transport system permease protein n=1 Tax=Saccharospirillum salsuginis TaxID=418750 RepID=A0A918N8V4_9GAMM|nr:ABC transporter permease [Saccharospirillum salsuginis]GGX48535.1 hypothetical protein GCM10007392_14460 [Saccharospirillum salsuginis]
MVDWALKTLWRDRRFALAVILGVAFSLLLATLVEGMFVGESRQVIAYPRDLSPDLWVAQEGVTNMHMSTSFINVADAYAIPDISGVGMATPLLYINGFVAHGDQQTFAYIVGTNSERTEPVQPVQGQASPGPGEVIIPRALARKFQVDIDDIIQVANEPVRITGIVEGYFSMANSIAFVDLDWLRDRLDLSSAVSFVLVDLAPGFTPANVSEDIRRRIDGVSVTEQARFLANDQTLALQMGGELIAIMSVVSALVAMLVVSWFVTLLVARYRAELAIAKAVGAGNAQLLFAILIQALLLSALGFALSVACAIPLEPLLARWRPDVAIHLPMVSFQRNAVLTLIIAVIATVIPVRRVLRVDPAEVFK